ncbi:MAG: MerR family transcriptional regulator [Elusimicrobiota bacterium]|jgi:DNA-binding transcriptional MerR regulator|nr:MerR family transcriptional regulator [Elusimicrobiota bacterium]
MNSDKEYWTIGEISEETQVPKHTLRYWEGEFKLLSPIRKSAGRRIYKKSDVDLIFTIKDLLHNKRYTTEGVKKYLLAKKRNTQRELKLNDKDLIKSDVLRVIESDLQEVLKLLKSNRSKN